MKTLFQCGTNLEGRSRKCNEAEDFNDVRERTYTRQHYQGMFREKHLE